jgi:hypothetical protein
MDYSKLSTEELKKLISDSEQNHGNEEAKQNEQPGFLKSLGQGYMNYAKGAIKGMGQAAGDLGASAINWPISGIEHLSGHKLTHVPHPNLLNENPESLSENIGQLAGQFGAALGLPGGAGMKAAQLANRGYETLLNGRQLPLIGKLLAGSVGGAAEGALGNEENRGTGAAIGSVIGSAGHAIPSAIDFARSMSSNNIAKDIINVLNQQKSHFSDKFQNNLASAEQAGANKFLRSEQINLPILKKAGEGKNIYALEKYNANPTLRNAHDAQSDLGRIVRKYSDSTKGTLERDAYNLALRTRNRLLQRISASMEKAGVPHLADEYGNIRNEYGKLVGPYLNSPTVSKFTQKNPSIRANKFADKLLEEENFVTRAGENHRGLLRRERYNALKKNKLAQGAALGLGTVATGFLPYGISKALGLK